jgi:hypothetical protein
MKTKLRKGFYTSEQLCKKYSGMYINTYPHHHEYWNEKKCKYETVYEVRGVSKTIRENYNLPEDELCD